MKLKTKKIIFFDGDGTLWYPEKTKLKQKPHWVYKDKSIKNYLPHLVLIPTVKSTLKKLKEKGVITIILSTHPQPKKDAYEILNEKVSYFKISTLFDEIHATREYHKSKGEYILKILKKFNIPKSKALMVGDNYPWDYKCVKDIGVEALLVKTDYMKKDKRLKVLEKFTDLLKCV